MDIVCFASADYEEPNWVNAQHLMTRLASRHRVLYVNSLGLRAPRATGRDLRKIARRLRPGGLRRPDPSRELFVLSPLALPPVRGAWAERLSAALLSARLSGSLARLGFSRPVAWAFLPTAAPVVERLALGPVIYHCVDAYEANPGADRAIVRALEDRLLARSRVVIASSAPLAVRFAGRHPRVLTLPNVADLDAYPRPGSALPEPRELAILPRPRIVYLGNLAAFKVDLALLAQAVRRRPGFAWVFIGDIGLGEAATPVAELRGLPNVYLLGPQPRARLAEFLHHCDVALIPFIENETTRHSFPMKFFEYLACGLPVVSASLPSLREHLVEPFALAYEGLSAFLQAIDRALAAGSPAAAARRRELAEAHSWNRRMIEMEELLAKLKAEDEAGRDQPAGAGRE